MNLESQVVSLDLAKRLKELGVTQESMFYWVCDVISDGPYLAIIDDLGIINKRRVSVYFDSGAEGDSWDVKECYSAFTVAELGELLSHVRAHGSPIHSWRGGSAFLLLCLLTVYINCATISI